MYSYTNKLVNHTKAIAMHIYIYWHLSSLKQSSTFCKIGHVLTCTLLGYSVSFQRRRDSPCVRRCWRCRRTDSSVAWHDPPHPPLPVRCGCLPGSEKTREMHCLVLHVKIMLKTLTDEVDSAKCNAFKGTIQTGPYKNSWHNKKHGSCKTEIKMKCSYQAYFFPKAQTSANVSRSPCLTWTIFVNEKNAYLKWFSRRWWIDFCCLCHHVNGEVGHRLGVHGRLYWYPAHNHVRVANRLHLKPFIHV